MTDIDLDAIEARANAATDGPWTDVATYRQVLAGLATMTGNHGSDGPFVRHARDDVPKMAAKIRDQAGEIARLRAEWDRLVNERAAMLGVVEAAKAWREFVGDDAEQFREIAALIAAVDALPNMQEPCDTCSSTGGGCPECRTGGLAAEVA